jgi:hypothetical protein
MGLFLVAIAFGCISAFAAAPGNDFFPGFALSGSLPITTSGTNVGATSEALDPPTIAGAATGGKTVWWKWTPTSSGSTVISLSGSSFDTLLGVYTGTGPFTTVAENDDFGGSRQSQVSFNATSGVTYRILVDGYAGATGNISLSVDIIPPPANDNLGNAADLTGQLPISLTASNVGATKELGEPNHAGNAGGASVWWSWKSNFSGTVAISTENSSIDTLLAVYTGNAFPLTLIASNDNTGASVTSRVSFNATAGTAYKIAVDGKAGAVGNINLVLAVPPPNDNLANATVLPNTSLPVNASGTNAYAGVESVAAEPATIAGFAVTKSVWWRWTAPASPASQKITVSTSGSSFDTLLAVYDGTSYPLTALVPAAESDNFPIFDFASQITFVATAGKTYSFQVDGKFGGTGNISILLTAPPANDDLANASDLGSALPVTIGGSNRFASKESSEPNHGADPGGSSVWWKWKAPATQSVTITTSGSNFDTLLAVYKGGTYPLAVATAENNNVGFSSQAQVTFSAAANTTYYIAVDGTNGQTGYIQLAIVSPPANDNFSAATDLNALFGSTYGKASTNLTNQYASLEAGEPAHAGTVGGASVWFKWTAPSSTGPVGISTTGSTFDTLLAIYTGPNVSTLTPVADNNNTSFSTQAETTFDAQAAQVYYIAVDGYYGATGSIVLTVALPPSNDDFANALTLSGTPPLSDKTHSNRFATKEPGEPDHAGFTGGPSVWWQWTSPSNGGKYTITTAGSDFYTLLAVYKGGAVNALTAVAGNFGGGGNTSLLTFIAEPSTLYHIAVDGYFGSTGNIFLTLRLANSPVNDDFANATALGSTLPVTVNGSNVEATKEAGEANHAGDKGGASVWWSFTAPTTGDLTVSLAGSDFATALAVYTGSSVNNLTPVASSTNGQITFAATAGQSYRLAVDGVNGATGNIKLTIGAPPPNDDFAQAITLPNPSSGPLRITFTGTTNNLASKEIGEPYHASVTGGASVWWKWTAPKTGKVTISTGGSSFSAVIAIYIGSSIVTLTPVASSSIGTVSLNAVAGTTYMIAVDGNYNPATFAADTGKVSLLLAEPPANDDFANAALMNGALPLSTSTQTPAPTNEGATKENMVGEPYHAGQPGGASVWWTWTSPITAKITITTAGSTFNTLLGVYTGTAVNMLTEVASNDDFGSSKTSQVTFSATAGTTYRIAVDGVNGQTGTVVLGIERFQKPDLVVQALSITSKNQKPTAGEKVTFTATVKNNGGRAGSFLVGFFLNSASAPTLATAADASARIDSLLANATASVDFQVTVGTDANYTAWAFADYADPNATGKGEQEESDETNNAGPSGGFAWAVVPQAPLLADATANGTDGAAFSYTITGTSTATLTYDATGLPTGLTLDKSTGKITGTPTTPGTSVCPVSATNTGGTTAAKLTIIIAAAVPTITSALSASGVQNQAFTYTITASGSPTITYAVDNLPSGLTIDTATGAISGTPVTSGDYTVTLNATNAAGADKKFLLIHIADANDIDGDGFSNALEQALGTDPNNSSSTPFGGAAAGAVQAMGVTGLKMSVNFSSASSSDSISLSGFVAGNALSADKSFVVNIGGIVKQFTLDAKGSAKSTDKKDSMKIAAKSGALNFSIKLSKGSFGNTLKANGNYDTTGATKVQALIIEVLYNKTTYRKDQFVQYAVKSGKAGFSGIGTEAKGGALPTR